MFLHGERLGVGRPRKAEAFAPSIAKSWEDEEPASSETETKLQGNSDKAIANTDDSPLTGKAKRGRPRKSDSSVPSVVSIANVTSGKSRKSAPAVLISRKRPRND